jgi:hypothetical protein
MELGDFAMERRMLKGIKARAERLGSNGQRGCRLSRVRARSPSVSPRPAARKEFR